MPVANFVTGGAYPSFFYFRSNVNETWATIRSSDAVNLISGANVNILAHATPNRWRWLYRGVLVLKDNTWAAGRTIVSARLYGVYDGNLPVTWPGSAQQAVYALNHNWDKTNLANWHNFGSVPKSEYITMPTGFYSDEPFDIAITDLSVINISGTEVWLGVRTKYDGENIEPNNSGGDIGQLQWAIDTATLEITWTVMSVQTDPATGVSSTGATLNGTLLDDGDNPPITVGFQAGDTPDTDDWEGGAQTGTEGNPFDAGFDAIAAGMSPGDTIYFRAYATDGSVTVYGEVLSFVLGVATRESYKILELAFGQSVFTESPVWTDVSEDLRSIHTKRGRVHELDRIEAGEARFELDNEHGNWWRYNSAGDYSPDVHPLTLIRCRGVWKGTYHLIFYGVVEKFSPDWIDGAPVVGIEAVDMFKTFAKYSLYANAPGATLFAEELTGTRIVNALNALAVQVGLAEWPASMMDVDPGTVSVSALIPPVGGTNFLKHAQQVAEAEGGLLFIGPDGRVVFQDADARSTVTEFKTSQATFKDDLTDSLYVQPKFSDDDEMIINGVNISGPGFTEVQVNDDAAQAIQGPRVHSVTDSLLVSQAVAFDQATQIVLKYVISILRVESLLIMPVLSPSDLWPKVLGYGLSTRITFQLNTTANPAGVDQQYHLEGIQYDWDAAEDLSRWRWQLWMVSKLRSFGTCPHDGTMLKEDANYTTAHDAVAADSVTNDAGVMAVGQANQAEGFPEDFLIWRAYLEIDTTLLLSTQSVVSGVLALHVDGTFVVDNDWVLQAVPATGVGQPVDASDYWDMLSNTEVLAQATIPAGTYTDRWLILTLTASGIAALVAEGITKMGLRSSKDISATSPGNDPAEEYFELHGSGTALGPRLILEIA